MKTFSQHISQVLEKLIINKDYHNNINYNPTEWKELKNIVIEKCNDEEFQKTGRLDMSDVDVSKIDDLSRMFCPEDYKYKGTSNNMNCGIMIKEMKSIDISGWDTSNVKTFFGMFKGCEYLENIIGIEDISLESADTLSIMFYECASLKKLDLSKWRPNKATMLGNMFSDCERLEEVIGLEKWQFAPIGNISLEGLFNACYKLQKVDISNWKVEHVRDTDYMFRNCVELESVGDLSKWNPEHLDSMEKMFFRCRKLRNIGDIENWYVDGKRLFEDDAFTDCDKSIVPEWYYKNYYR